MDKIECIPQIIKNTGKPFEISVPDKEEKYKLLEKKLQDEIF